MELKVIQAGSVIEVYKYHNYVSLPKSPFKVKKYGKYHFVNLPNNNPASSANRARRSFIRRVNSNSGIGLNSDCLLSLTFKPSRLCDLEAANYEWKKFRQKLERLVPNLRYCISYEWGSKTGRFHYHVILFDFPFVDKAVLEEKWSNGFINIKKIDNKTTYNVGAYVAKYMAKDMLLGRHIDNKRRFFSSRNLNKPKIFRFYFRRSVNAIISFFSSFKPVIQFVFNSTMRFISGFDFAMYALPPNTSQTSIAIMLDSYADLVG